MADNAVYKSILLCLFERSEEEETQQQQQQHQWRCRLFRILVWLFFFFLFSRRVYRTTHWTNVVIIVVLVPGCTRFRSTLLSVHYYFFHFFFSCPVQCRLRHYAHLVSWNLSIIRQRRRKKAEHIFFFVHNWWVDTQIHKYTLLACGRQNFCGRMEVEEKSKGKKNEKQRLRRLMFVNKMLCHFPSSGDGCRFLTSLVSNIGQFVSVVAAPCECHISSRLRRIMNHEANGKCGVRAWLVNMNMSHY